MRTTIDRAGRVVVPKQFREAMGLTAGGKVDIVYSDGRITIEMAPAELELIDDGGVPALRAVGVEHPAPPADMVRDTIEAIREERDDRLV